MIGVHRSANTSAPSAIGQYCPYPSTPPTILRRPARAAVRISNFFRFARPSMLAAMTTTAAQTSGHWATTTASRSWSRTSGRRWWPPRASGPGMRVLDVGAGTGNAALPAAAAGADVVATDITPELLAVGERHARERGLDVRWQVADAQALPFADGEFDAVLSCIGAMFAPDHAATARELLRVCRPGGTVVMANWTPGGGVGPVLRLLGRYGPPAGDGPSPTCVGRSPATSPPCSRGRRACTTEPRRVRLGFTGPPAEVAAYYRRHFPPVIATLAGLDDDGPRRWSAS